MTREELRARVRSEIERQGQAAVPAGEVWGAFAAPGENSSVPFDAALLGFAAYNGWRVRRVDADSADTLVFYPARQESPPLEDPRGP